MRLQNPVGIIKYTKSGPRLPWLPGTRFTIFQGMVASLVGVFLGILLVLALSDDLGAMLFLVGLAVSPFLLVIAASLVGDLKKLLLIVILLEIPIGVDFNYKFSEEVARLNAVSGFNISLTTLCLIFLYSWWFAEIVTRRAKPLPPGLFRMSLPLMAYLGVVIFSTLFAKVPILAFFEINLLLQACLIYIYIIYATRTRQDLLLVIACLLIGLFLESLIMIAARAIGSSLELGIISIHVDPRNMRVGGTIGSPNGAGSYLTLMLVSMVSVITMPLGRWYKRLAAIAFVLGSVALILTLSRGAWGSFALAITVFWLLAWRQGWLSLKIPIIALVCAIPIVIVLYPLLITRLFGDDGGAAESRLPLMRLAFRMITDHWLFGVGANNFAANLLNYVTPEFSMDWITTVHNKFLLVWAETGIFGVITFVWFLVSTARQGWQVWKLHDRFLSPLALCFSLAIVAWMMHMMVDLFHQPTQIQLLLLVAGLVIAMYNMSPLNEVRMKG